MGTSTGSTCGCFKKSMVGGYNAHNRRHNHSINHQTSLGTNMMTLFSTWSQPWFLYPNTCLFFLIFIDLWTYTAVNRYGGDPTPCLSTKKNYTLNVEHFLEHTLKSNVHSSGTRCVSWVLLYTVLDKNNRKTLKAARAVSCSGLPITRSSNDDPTVTRSGNSSRCIGRTPILF